MPNTQPLVSIVVPCYNSAPFIAETLDSVIVQTHTNWECVVVDDHSTDNSVKIIEEYSRQYPEKIKLFTNPRKGACAARNFAFEKSQGGFIQYLDADDLLSNNKLEKQVEALIHSPEKVAVCNTWHFSKKLENAYNTDSNFVFSSRDPANFLINLWGGYGEHHYIALHSWLTHRDLIKQVGVWNENLHKDQDGEFFARVLLAGQGVVYTPGVKSFYRKHTGGNNIASQKKRKHIESNLLSTELKEKYLFKVNNSKDANRAIATQYKHVAIEAWPQFKDICKSALRKCNQLGGTNYSPKLGGRVIEFLKKTLGWKAAKSVSYHVHENKILKQIISKLKS